MLYEVITRMSIYRADYLRLAGVSCVHHANHFDPFISAVDRIAGRLANRRLDIGGGPGSQRSGLLGHLSLSAGIDRNPVFQRRRHVAGGAGGNELGRRHVNCLDGRPSVV